jgi:membrane protein implicated in regulation of membrane protease activity
MPLIFAPVEYWANFGIFIAILVVALVVWAKKVTSRGSTQSHHPNPANDATRFNRETGLCIAK